MVRIRSVIAMCAFAAAGAETGVGFIKNLRWQPSVELGFGDDKLSLYGNFMAGYYFPVQAAVTPYAGPQVTVWLFDDGFNAEIGSYAVGGIGDVPDVRVLVGWTFK